MDGFANLIRKILAENEIDPGAIRHTEGVELRGYYRPSKKWDLLVIRKRRLNAAMEFKSQVGPSFSNNFNNRVEEAIGSAIDLRAAFRKGSFPGPTEPWLGYLFLLHKDPASTKPVEAAEPNFHVLPELKSASYAKRYEILCQRLVAEGLYDASCLILSSPLPGIEGAYEEPRPDLSFIAFVRSLLKHLRDN